MKAKDVVGNTVAWGETDERKIEYIYPKRIVWQSGAPDAEKLCASTRAQAALECSPACILKKGSSILIDFGTELQGGIQIITDIWAAGEDNTAKVRVRFGESASEAMSEIHKESNATNDHAIRDSVYTISWLGMTEIGNTGFRFVRIDMLSSDPIPLRCVRAKFQYLDAEYLGTFECDDERINDIWKAAAYTVQLNMQQYVWDGIKRDRLVWVGDMHPEISSIKYIFGDMKCVRRSLDLMKEITPVPKIMNNIPAYSLWWILIHYEWYYSFADKEYLASQHDYIVALMHEYAKQINDDGTISTDNCFLDWPSSTNEDGQRAGYHALFTLVCEKTAFIMRELGDNAEAEFADGLAKKLRGHLYSCGGLKQALAMQVLAEEKDAKKAYEELLGKDGVKGFSTFFGFYVLKALAKSGHMDFALDCMKKYWGGMLDTGSNTFWEDFDLEWVKDGGRIDEVYPDGTDVHGANGAYCYKGYRHSLCHGWASGPAPFLMEYVLGVKPAAPGFKKVRINPTLGPLRRAKGTVPTPYGIIRVELETGKDGKVKTKIELPEGIELV